MPVIVIVAEVTVPRSVKIRFSAAALRLHEATDMTTELPERSLIHESMLALLYVLVRAALALVCRVTSVSNRHEMKQFAADAAFGAITSARRNEMHPLNVAESDVMVGVLMVMVFSS